jgi:penicillin-binding protein 1C
MMIVRQAAVPKGQSLQAQNSVSLYKAYRRTMIALGIIAILALFNLLLPPDIRRAQDISRDVLAADGTALRTYLTRDGMVRHDATLGTVNQRYLDLLIAYEDQRFYRHSGVDGLSILRATGQDIRAGKIVSGGSTLTMQVARLLEPRPRGVIAKLMEMIRAWQLELHYSKREILAMYIKLAPMGGNLEGIEAASRQYFNKPAKSLSLSDAATLIALPQSPTRLRRDMVALKIARNKILAIAGARAGYRRADIIAAQASPVGLHFQALRFSAPQLADRMLATSELRHIQTTLIAGTQLTLERNAPRWRRTLDPRASLAILVADIRTREVRAYVATADFAAKDRSGQVDMVTAIRSPGSALKPFLYARAFDQGIAHPLTLVDDVETRFGSYTPTNFQEQYHGRVTLTDALRLSLNVPAVLLMDRIGPVAFTEQMRRDGLDLQLPKGVRPGLPVALGGVGVTLENLVAAYCALADDGIIKRLRFATKQETGNQETGNQETGNQETGKLPDAFAGEAARVAVATILRTTNPPDGVANRSSATRAIALKTGTSYGYRDAWGFGFDGKHVVGVWTGRPDGTPSPGRFGVNTAAPILYDVFDLIGVRQPVIVPNTLAQAPAALTSLTPGPAQRTLKIAFPVDGAIVPYIAGKAMPLEVRGGKAPYLWIANGDMVGEASPGQSLMWTPDGPGFHTLTLVDATGRATSVRIRISETVGFVP